MDDVYVSALFDFESYFNLFIALTGLIGNSLMFVVYSQKRLKKLSISTYFRALAISNILINLLSITFFITDQFHFNIHASSSIACKLTRFIYSLPTPISAWLAVAAGLDRFLIIVYRFKFLKRPRFRHMVVVVILAFNVVINCHLLFDSKIQTSSSSTGSYSYCVSLNSYANKYIDIINSAVAPFTFMLFTSIATFWGVISTRDLIRTPTRTGRVRKSRKRDTKFGVTMIIMNVVFFLLNAPIRLAVVVKINPFSKSSQLFGYFFFFALIHIMNEALSSVCFYVHLAVNSLVRKELKGVLRLNGVKQPIGQAKSTKSFTTN